MLYIKATCQTIGFSSKIILNAPRNMWFVAQNPLGHRQIHAQDNSSSYDSLSSMFTKTCHLFLVGLAVSHTLGSVLPLQPLTEFGNIGPSL